MGFRNMLKLRPFSLLVYILYAVVGGMVLATPLPSYVQTSGHLLTLVWASLMIGGGCLGILEYFLESRISEIVGLIFLIVATLSYGLVLLTRASSPVYGLMILILACKLGNRLIDIYRLYNMARRVR